MVGLIEVCKCKGRASGVWNSRNRLAAPKLPLGAIPEWWYVCWCAVRELGNSPRSIGVLKEDLDLRDWD